MKKSRIVYDEHSWFRRGHGHGFEFFATKVETNRFIQTCFPPEFLIVFEDGQRKLIEKSINDFLEVYDSLSGFFKIFVYTREISSINLFDFYENFSALCSLNGLIKIQFFKYDAIGASAIGIVGMIENERSGEVVHHKEYLRYYNRLKRIIKKHLRYHAVVTNKIGLTWEHPNIFLTEGIAEEIRRGVPCKAKIGSPIKTMK